MNDAARKIEPIPARTEQEPAVSRGAVQYRGGTGVLGAILVKQ